MVAFIWIACFFCLVMVQVFIKYQGVILGAIPTMILYGFTLWLARTLASKWKKRQAAKQTKEENKSADSYQDIYHDPSIRVNYRDVEPAEEMKEEAKVVTLADVRDADKEQEDDEKMPTLVKVIVICAAIVFVLLILISSLSKM